MENLKQEGAAKPWWRYPMVWLVISGPLCVVIASFVTFWFAARAPDPVLKPEYGQAVDAEGAGDGQRELVPAMIGRNHAATPSRDVPK